MEQLQRIFIRPSRHVYNVRDLGPTKFKISNRQAFRRDISIINTQGKSLQTSLYSFQPLAEVQYIIVYLHCNSGSRVQGAAHTRQVLSQGYSLLVFDFMGSGLSDGDFVTLGVNESEDIKSVIEYLKRANPIVKIALWGRSMGAVASLLYLQTHGHMVEAAVFDSPFYSLKQLANDIGSNLTNLPKFMVDGFMRILNSRLKEKTQTDMLKALNVDMAAQNVRTPGLFLGSKTDKLVPFRHIETLYNCYRGEYKEIYYLEQDHHERRTPKTVEYVLGFIKKYLKPSLRAHKKSVSQLSAHHLTTSTSVIQDPRHINPNQNIRRISDNGGKLKSRMINIGQLTKQNRAKHSLSQLDFRQSIESCRKIELVSKTARKYQQQQQQQDSHRIRVAEDALSTHSNVYNDSRFLLAAKNGDTDSLCDSTSLLLYKQTSDNITSNNQRTPSHHQPYIDRRKPEQPCRRRFLNLTSLSGRKAYKIGPLGQIAAIEADSSGVYKYSTTLTDEKSKLTHHPVHHHSSYILRKSSVADTPVRGKTHTTHKRPIDLLKKHSRTPLKQISLL